MLYKVFACQWIGNPEPGNYKKNYKKLFNPSIKLGEFAHPSCNAMHLLSGQLEVKEEKKVSLRKQLWILETVW